MSERDRAEADFRSRTILGGVLIGGRSARMGRPKHLLPIEGRTFLERIARAMRPHAREIFVLGEGDLPPELDGLTRLYDAPDAEGPLAGILAAVRREGDATWLIAPCDMPRLTERAFAWLLTERAPDRAAVLPLNRGGRPEPLAAVYEPEAALLLERLVASGKTAPRALRGEPRVHLSPIPPDLEPDFRDVDAPEDL